MSKKTNAAKLKARTTNPRKNAHKRGRKNPAFKGAPLSSLTDPILMHHIAGFILRTMELYIPKVTEGMGNYPRDTFATPSGITPKSEVN